MHTCTIRQPLLQTTGVLKTPVKFRHKQRGDVLSLNTAEISHGVAGAWQACGHGGQCPGAPNQLHITLPKEDMELILS